MLRSERVTLRPMTEEDLPAYLRFINDCEIHFLGSDGPPVPTSLPSLLQRFKEHNTSTSPWFAMEVEGEFIGQCLLYSVDHYNGTCAIGLTIGNRDYWGKGIGSEVVVLLCDYAFRILNIRKVWLQTTGNNHRGIRCYEKCGFATEGKQIAQVWMGESYEDLITMGLLKSNWHASTQQNRLIR